VRACEQAEYLDVVCERLALSDKMAPRTLADYPV